MIVEVDLNQINIHINKKKSVYSGSHPGTALTLPQ